MKYLKKFENSEYVNRIMKYHEKIDKEKMDRVEKMIEEMDIQDGDFVQMSDEFGDVWHEIKSLGSSFITIYASDGSYNPVPRTRMERLTKVREFSKTLPQDVGSAALKTGYYNQNKMVNLDKIPDQYKTHWVTNESLSDPDNQEEVKDLMSSLGIDWEQTHYRLSTNITLYSFIHRDDATVFKQHLDSEDVKYDYREHEGARFPYQVIIERPVNEEVSWGGIKKKFSDFFNDPSDEEREVEEITNKTLEESFHKNTKDFFGYMDHSALIGVETDMNRDLQKALEGRTLLQGGRERDYDHIVCGEMVKKWFRKNQKEVYKRLYSKR